MTEEEKTSGTGPIKKLVYTEQCGYGYVDFCGKSTSSDPVLTNEEKAQLPEMNLINLKSGATVTLDKSLIQNTIGIRVKSFHGSRKIYNLEAHIGESIDSLREKLLKVDVAHELDKFKKIRLVHTIGKLKDLSGTAKIADLDITHGTLLVAMGVKSFSWDPFYKGNYIEVENNNMTVYKQKEQDTESILGTIGFSSGRCYWEITIDEIAESEDLIIGVALRDIDLYMHPSEGLAYYGYICCAGRKVSINDEGSNYGEMCNVHDKVGVLLEFTGKEAQLSFYRNKMCMGVAFSGLPLDVYYPVATMYYYGSKITLNCSVEVPPSC